MLLRSAPPTTPASVAVRLTRTAGRAAGEALLDDPRVTLGVARIAVGVAAWVLPRTTWRLAGLGAMSESDRASATVVTRLFGARDVALGAAVLHPDTEVQRLALQAGVVADGADAVAAVVGVAQGAPKASALGTALVAVGACALGVRALEEL